MTATIGQAVDSFDNARGAPQPAVPPQGSGLMGGTLRSVANPDDAGNDSAALAAAALASNGDETDDEKKRKAFLKALLELYKVQVISPEIAKVLENATIDTSKTAIPGTLYAKFGDAEVTITETSISTTAEMTPELAYQMASAASIRYQTVELTGSDDEKAMLLWAAKHFNLNVSEASIPTILAENVGPLREKLFACESRMGLRNSVVETCFQGLRQERAPAPVAAAPAPTPAAAPTTAGPAAPQTRVPPFLQMAHA